MVGAGAAVINKIQIGAVVYDNSAQISERFILSYSPHVKLIVETEFNRIETQFQESYRTKNCIGVDNDQEAVHPIFRAASNRPVQEVVVSSHNSIAAWLVVSNTVATPLAVEAITNTFNIDLKNRSQNITSKTDALLSAHVYGRKTDKITLAQIYQRHNLLHFEDTPLARGSRPPTKTRTKSRRRFLSLYRDEFGGTKRCRCCYEKL